MNMKQLEINFGTTIKTSFDESFIIPTEHCGRIVETYSYTRREKGQTFLRIGGVNFCGQPTFDELIAISLPMPDFYGHLIPRLQSLSLEEIKAFARNVVNGNIKNQWNSETRTREYILNAGEMILRSPSVQKDVDLYKTLSEAEKEQLDILLDNNCFINKKISCLSDKKLMKTILKRLVEQGIATVEKGGYKLKNSIGWLIINKYQPA